MSIPNTGFPTSYCQSAYLTHPVFHMNRAESEMTRYMRRLADRDLAPRPGHDPAWLVHDEA